MARKTTEAQMRATKKYQSENTKQILLKFNNKTDSAILEKLESVPNKQGYVRGLILADIAREQEAGERRQ